MTETAEVTKHYDFFVQPGFVQQGCLECAAVFRIGQACVLVQHEGARFVLGTLEPVACPRCKADKTDKSPAFFDSTDAAVEFVLDLNERLERRDPTATFLLLSTKTVGIGSDTVQ